MTNNQANANKRGWMNEAPPHDDAALQDEAEENPCRDQMDNPEHMESPDSMANPLSMKDVGRKVGEDSNAGHRQSAIKDAQANCIRCGVAGR